MNRVSRMQRTIDAIGHLQQYGNVVDDDRVLDVLEALARINDDLAHGREPTGMRNDVDAAHAALDSILAPAARRTILGDMPVNVTGIDRLDHALVSTRDAFEVERRSCEQRMAALSERLDEANERLVESGKAQRLRNRRDSFAERVAVALVAEGAPCDVVKEARKIADAMYPGAQS